MNSISRKVFALGFAAIGFSLLTHSAKAGPPGGALPAPNLDFLDYTGVAPKAEFTAVDPVGWTGGTDLVFIATPGNSTVSSSACGSTYLTTYGCPSTLAINGGKGVGVYNEIEADGNPAFESGFNYEITGLTVGDTYTLSFYQAASQQTTFSGATTEQWIVSLGTVGLSTYAINGSTDGYHNLDATASVAATTLMNTPSHGLVDWNFVSVSLTADATSDLLSFLAWGNNGSTINEPPMVFLTGVNAPPGLATPEPAGVALFGTLLIGLGVATWRRRPAAKV
jgi:hypothetical protein